MQRDHLVVDVLELGHCLRRGDGDGQHDAPGPASAQHLAGRPGCPSSGDAVVDDHDRASLDVGPPTIAAVAGDSTSQLLALLVDDRSEPVPVQAQPRHHVLRDDLDVALADRADGELAMARRADLADDHHVQGCVEPAGDLAGHG